MVAAIIQARMGSTRLPGKVLMDLNGKALIDNIIFRLKKAEKIDEILVATTTNPIDDELVWWCERESVRCFRGDENNVLKRYYDAARFIGADVIVRITADDPFKDPGVIDAVIKQLQDDDLDFSYNNCPTSFPEGLDTEVFTFKAIEQAYYSDTTDYEKEHVTQFFYHNPDLFRMKNYSYKENVSDIRLTVDSEEDLELARKIYSNVSRNGEMFYLEEVLELLRNNPEWLKINKNVKRSAMYE